MKTVVVTGGSRGIGTHSKLCILIRPPQDVDRPRLSWTSTMNLGAVTRVLSTQDPVQRGRQRPEEP